MDVIVESGHELPEQNGAEGNHRTVFVLLALSEKTLLTEVNLAK